MEYHYFCVDKDESAGGKVVYAFEEICDAMLFALHKRGVSESGSATREGLIAEFSKDTRVILNPVLRMGKLEGKTIKIADLNARRLSYYLALPKKIVEFLFK